MNQTIPRSVMPILYVESVDELRTFYVDKLGFDHMMGVLGKDGKLDFCTVTLDGARIMLYRLQEKIAGAEGGFRKRAVDMYIEVADVDAYHDEVAGRGVRILTPLETKWWGDRTFQVSDPYGYTVWFYQSVAEPEPPKGAKLV